MFRVTFSNNFWSRFSETIKGLLFSKGELRYDFGYGLKDVKTVAKFHRDAIVRERLFKILKDNKLVHISEYTTVARIVKWVNYNYPSNLFYTKDRLRDSWNNPNDTLDSFEVRASLADLYPGNTKVFYNNLPAWKACVSTDCDDYAILIYNLLRVAGVPAERLFLCWMKTSGEWHMNCMYYHKGVPYALEGTYFPVNAMNNFGKQNYFNTLYYKYVKWIFNEEEVLRYVDKINPLGTD